MILRTNTDEIKPMKVMDLRSKSAEKAYLTQDPKHTHTKDEMASLLRAIEFTKMFKQAESLAKMDEEEVVMRPLPRM